MEISSYRNIYRENSFPHVRKWFLLSWLPRIAKFLQYHGSVYIPLSLLPSVHRRPQKVFWASSGQEFTKRCRFTYPALFRTYSGIARASLDFFHPQKAQKNHIFTCRGKKRIYQWSKIRQKNCLIDISEL